MPPAALVLSPRTHGSLRAAALSLCLGLAACGTSATPDSARSGQAPSGSSGSSTSTSASTALAATTSAPTASAGPEPARPKVKASAADIAAATKGDAAFALSLWSKAATGPGNVFLSPASARVALAMTSAGARGETQKQMAAVLGLPSDPSVHNGMGGLLASWLDAGAGPLPAPDPEVNASPEPFQLRVANRLFGQKGKAFAAPFTMLLDEAYAAPLEPLDFRASPEPSRVHVNDWVAKQTRDRIRDLLPSGSVTAETRLVLVNAIYFKGDWAQPFKKESTREEDFFVTPTKKVRAPTMLGVGQHRFAETADVQVVELDYRGAPFAMTIVLPKAKDGLAKLEQGLDAKGLEALLAGLATQKVTVWLPKLKIESSFELGPTLASLGMRDAFSDKADFSGMTGDRDLVLSRVIQKTFCAVDEKGTEAAAATAVLARAGAAPPREPPREVRADHPFLFLLRDKANQSIVFMGRVTDPTAK